MSSRTSALPEYLLSLLAMLCWTVPLVCLFGLAARRLPWMDVVVANTATSAWLAGLTLFVCVAVWLTLLHAFTREPPAQDTRDYLRVTYFGSEDGGQGGLWLSRTTVHLVTGLRHRQIALATIRDVRVEPRHNWFVRLNRFAKDYPLVLDLEDGSTVRAFVHAPRSLASEILAARDAYADATPVQPYRRSPVRA